MPELGSDRLSGSKKILRRVNDFRSTEVLCDVKVVVDGRVFPAHKIILAGFSPYFEAMFTRDFAEAQQESVTINAIEAVTVESLLNYAYTDEIAITRENVLPLLHAASFLQIRDVYESACEFLSQNLSAETCVEAFSLAEVYSCLQLRKRAKNFILSNFSDVSHSVGFLEIEAEKVIDIIDDDSLYVSKEEIVCDAVIRWFHYKENERKADLAKVLSCVRLAHVEPSFLLSRVKTNKALRDTEPVSKLIEEVLWYHLVPSQKNQVYSSFTKRRSNSSDVEVLIVHGRSLTAKENILLYVSEEGKVVGEMPWCSAMYWWSACNYRMHLLSGDDKRTIMFFDPEASEWKPAFKLKRRFEGRSSLVNVDGRWFSFGDSSAEKDNGPHKYDTATKVWKKIAAPLTPIVNADVITLHGMIYVARGNIKRKKAPSRIEQYDPVADTWTQATCLPVPRDRPRICGFNGRIYVFSGFSLSLGDEDDDACRVDVYDILTNQWQRCADVPHKLHNSYMTSPVVLGGRIYILAKPPNSTPQIQVYCPTSDTWENFDKNEIPDLQLQCIQGPLLISRP